MDYLTHLSPHKGLLTVLMSVLAMTLAQHHLQAQCGCTNCPVDLPDELDEVFTANINVSNVSNNTLGVNNTLEQVCLDITHDWIGDLDISLTAPDGTTVLLFGDGNNDSTLGGDETCPCGNSGDNMDLCFVIPSLSAPNTFGEEGTGNCSSQSYSDPCNGTDPCYTGAWGTFNEGCQGGTGLDQFNNGAGTVNGVWTLTINDNAGANEGILNDVQLLFATAPDGSCESVCDANVGTFNISPASPIVLCQGDSWSTTSNDDYILPPPASTSATPELMYAVYDCSPPANPDPEVDACFSGQFWTGEDVSASNPGGTNSNTAGGIPTALVNAGITGTNNTIWYVPVTVDDGDNDSNSALGVDNNADGCYDVGTPIAITYLPTITFASSPTCDNSTGTGTIEVTIAGGLPPYSLADVGDGTINTTTVTNSGGTFTLTLSDDDAYSVNLTDANGCTRNFSGTFNCNIVVPGSPCANTTAQSISDFSSTTSLISNSGSVSPMGTGVTLNQVCVLIEHTFNGDLEISLTSPDGTTIDLSSDNGGASEDYGDVSNGLEVCFTMSATQNITSYSGGAIGEWLPEGSFSSFDGENPNGNWTLAVFDDGIGDVGTLLSWSLEFSNGDCPPPVCNNDNDDCTDAEIVSLTSEVETCVVGCTIDAADNSSILGNGCDDITGAALWYQFTTVDYALDIDVTSSDIPDLQIQLWTACDTFLTGFGSCVTGSGGVASLLGAPGSGETFYLSISSASGTEGYFELCINNYPDPSPCNVDNTLVATPPATDFPNDMYPPGTTVEFCYTINDFERGACNWLHGIVPSWGDCWTTNPGTQPTVTTALQTAGENMPNGTPHFGGESGSWDWYADGVVLYNNIANGSLPPGTPVGAGWFFTTAYDSHNYGFGTEYEDLNPNPGDPNESYGDGFTGDGSDEDELCEVTVDFGFTWEVCFQLTTKDFVDACSNNADCSVSIKTYGDGETGVWESEGCYLDLATTLSASQCCVADLPLSDDTACEGSTYTINSGYTGTGTVNWYNQATGGTPIASGVDFTTPALTYPGPFAYYVEVEDEGCLSNRTGMTLTVDPLPQITLDDFSPELCLGESAFINTTVDYETSISWSEASFGANEDPTFTPATAGSITYTLSATNACGTVSRDVVILVKDPITVDAGADLTLCEGQTAYIGAYSPSPNNPYYVWDNGVGEIDQFTVTVGATDVTYTVTVSDDLGCTATDQITIFSTADEAPTFDNCPAADITANNDPDVCEADVTLPDLTATDDCAPPTLTASNGVALLYYGTYNGHYYYVTQSVVTPSALGVGTQPEAMAAVQAAAQEFSEEGYLATINDAAENTFATQVGYYYGDIITGYTDEEAEGSFGWFGDCTGCNGSGSGYTNWNSGEPNNIGDEDYAVLVQGTGLWNDASLLSVSHHAIVEFNQLPEESVSISCDYSTGTFPVGTTTVTCTATDWAGNTADCIYDVVVADNENPTPLCQDISVDVSSGTVTITAAQIDNGSDDNCGVQSLSVSPDTFDCNDQGDNTVTLTVMDIHGNSATCTATVTVNPIPIGFIRN